MRNQILLIFLLCFNFAFSQVQQGSPSPTIDFNPKLWLDSSQLNKYSIYPEKTIKYFSETSNKDSTISSCIDTFHFNNGVLEGLSIEYYENGNIRSIELSHRGFSENNTSLNFSENGQVLNYVIYYPEAKSYKFVENFPGTLNISKEDSCSSIWNEMGRACLDRFYFENGNISAEFHTNDGNTIHPYKEYYPNGQVKVDGHCIVAPWYLTGKFKGYYEDGKLRSIYNYKNAKDYTECTIKDGEWIDYDENGKVIQYELWKNGVKIK